jgi:hypothetical protein
MGTKRFLFHFVLNLEAWSEVEEEREMQPSRNFLLVQTPDNRVPPILETALPIPLDAPVTIFDDFPDIVIQDD